MKAKMFIIEDDINLLSALQAKLSVLGFEVESHNGAGEITALVEKLLEFKPDYMILDLVLPDIDCFELLKKINGYHSLQNLPIFIFRFSVKIIITRNQRLRVSFRLSI